MSSNTTVPFGFVHRVQDEYPFLVSDEFPVVIVDPGENP